MGSEPTEEEVAKFQRRIWASLQGVLKLDPSLVKVLEGVQDEATHALLELFEDRENALPR